MCHYIVIQMDDLNPTQTDCVHALLCELRDVCYELAQAAYTRGDDGSATRLIADVSGYEDQISALADLRAGLDGGVPQVPAWWEQRRGDEGSSGVTGLIMLD